METDRYWGVHYRYCPALRIDLKEGRRVPRNKIVSWLVRLKDQVRSSLRNDRRFSRFSRSKFRADRTVLFCLPVKKWSLTWSFCCSGGMAGQHYCLRWNNYQSNMTSVFHQLLQTEAFVDVTLACNEASLKAHKVSEEIFREEINIRFTWSQ